MESLNKDQGILDDKSSPSADVHQDINNDINKQETLSNNLEFQSTLNNQFTQRESINQENEEKNDEFGNKEIQTNEVDLKIEDQRVEKIDDNIDKLKEVKGKNEENLVEVTENMEKNDENAQKIDNTIQTTSESSQTERQSIIKNEGKIQKQVENNKPNEPVDKPSSESIASRSSLKKPNYESNDLGILEVSCFDQIQMPGQTSKFSDSRLSVRFTKSYKDRLLSFDLIEQEKSQFGLLDWAEFQDILKDQYHLITNEIKSKDTLIESVTELITEYNKLHLKIRESNEIIRRKFENRGLKYDPKEDEVIKAIIDDKASGLGDAYSFIRSFLFNIYDNPQILSTVLKSFTESSKLKALEETLCNTFYENIISDEAYDFDLICFLAELLKVEFEKAEKISNLFTSGNFSEKMLSAYVRRYECKKYAKSILKNPLIKITQNNNRLQIDPKNILDEQNKRNPSNTPRARATGQSFQFGPIPKLTIANAPSPVTISGARGNSTTIYVELFKDYAEEIKMRNNHINPTGPALNPALLSQEESKIPKFNGKTKKIKPGNEVDYKINITTPDITQDPEFIPHKVRSISKCSDLLKAGPEAQKIFSDSLALIKEYLNCLIASLFENLPSMPTGIRILCKIINVKSKEKFPHISKREQNFIMGNFLLSKWFIPFFVCPAAHGILDDFTSTTNIDQNLLEIGKVLKKIFLQELYSPDELLAEINSYIQEVSSSIEEYYDELIDINETLVEHILEKKDPSLTKNKIKSRAICISLQEVKLLVECVCKYQDEIKKIAPHAVNLANKINFYQNENKIFSEKYDPESKKKLDLCDAYILFQELIFPRALPSNYLDEFNKLLGFKKELDEKSKLLIKVKQVLKQMLISIEDMKNLQKLSTDRDLTLNDVLDKYQDKLYAFESKHATGKEKVPVNITARFLLASLKKIDEKYKENNYRLLYEEMVKEFKTVSNDLNNIIIETKLQFLKGVDTARRNYTVLKEINEKKKNTLKKTMVRDFVDTVNIDLCITSPSTRKILPPKGGKSNANPGDRIILVNQKECQHERFSFMKDLASSKIEESKTRAKKGTISIVNDRNVLDDPFSEKYSHCSKILEFIEIFGNLAEVREVSLTGDDHAGVNDALTLYLDSIFVLVKQTFKDIKDEEYKNIMDEIENYITKRLYLKIYPPVESIQDTAFWTRCKVLEWVTYDHLEIHERNRCDDMWDYAAKIFTQVDNKLTPLEKLDCIVECFRTITQVCSLSSAKDESAGADETLPLLIYVILKAAPRRIYSNMNFITAFHHAQKMLAGEGYCFTQVKSAVSFIETLNHQYLKMNELDFEKQIYEKEQKYEIIYLKRRNRSERVTIDLSKYRNSMPTTSMMSNGETSTTNSKSSLVSQK